MQYRSTRQTRKLNVESKSVSYWGREGEGERAAVRHRGKTEPQGFPQAPPWPSSPEDTTFLLLSCVVYFYLVFTSLI